MSEAVVGGAAVAAVAPCLAVAGLAAAAAYSIYRSVKWLSEQGKREMERLEKELAAPPTHATTREAQQAFEEAFRRAKSKAAQLPSLKEHADTVARVLALKGSPLGAFLGNAQWAQIAQPSFSKTSFGKILDQAAQAFTQANARAVAQSIVTVAQRAGFDQGQPDRREVQQGRISLVLKDPDGRALLASVTPADDGAQITLDLTGFGDPSCHEVMDQILAGLAEEQIHLDHLRRRSHYRREGLPVARTHTLPPQPTPQQSMAPRTVTDAERSRERTRRQRQSGPTLITQR